LRFLSHSSGGSGIFLLVVGFAGQVAQFVATGAILGKAGNLAASTDPKLHSHVQRFAAEDALPVSGDRPRFAD
jgi:hypothetical protein